MFSKKAYLGCLASRLGCELLTRGLAYGSCKTKAKKVKSLKTTYHRWTCGQFAVEGVVSIDVERNGGDSEDEGCTNLGTGHGCSVGCKLWGVG